METDYRIMEVKADTNSLPSQPFVHDTTVSTWNHCKLQLLYFQCEKHFLVPLTNDWVRNNDVILDMRM